MEEEIIEAIISNNEVNEDIQDFFKLIKIKIQYIEFRENVGIYRYNVYM